MAPISDRPINEVIELLSPYDIDYAFIIPTETGLTKSIIDATIPIRLLLKKNNIHDYALQSQGVENKEIVKANLIFYNSIKETTMTLYRPNTKQGDPRLWIKGLPYYCKPNNLLLVAVYNKEVFLVNTSDKQVMESINLINSPLGSFLSQFLPTKSRIADELLEKMKEVSSKGFIESKYTGSTSIGIVLAENLGIAKYDMSKKPDYKGIEIKSYREFNSRSNLFSQVPNWKKSTCRSGKDIIDKYGYFESYSGRHQLYCTVRANIPNPQGLFFSLDEINDVLESLHDLSKREKVVLWDMSVLRGRLLEKHPETFWVATDVIYDQGKEYFHYTHVVHTKNPKLVVFDTFLNNGRISMDFAMHKKSTGVRDHGYLFKIFHQDLEYLIPIIGTYQLH